MGWSGNNAVFGMWYFICGNMSVLEYVLEYKWHLQVQNSSTEENNIFPLLEGRNSNV